MLRKFSDNFLRRKLQTHIFYLRRYTSSYYEEVEKKRPKLKKTTWSTNVHLKITDKIQFVEP